jgi:hypothetical protein
MYEDPLPNITQTRLQILVVLDRITHTNNELLNMFHCHSYPNVCMVSIGYGHSFPLMSHKFQSCKSCPMIFLSFFMCGKIGKHLVTLGENGEI